MNDTTAGLGLSLPKPEDYYDIEVFNENARLVDAAAGQMQREISFLSAKKANTADVIHHTALYTEPSDLHAGKRGLIAVNPEGAGAPTINKPDGINWGVCLATQYGVTRQLLAMDGVNLWLQGHHGIDWTAWRKVAIAEAVQRYSIALASGFTTDAFQESVISKNQFGFVWIDFNAVICDRAVSAGDIPVATLPIGFYPTKLRDRILPIYIPTGEHFFVRFRFWTNGSVTVLMDRPCQARWSFYGQVGFYV